MDAQLEKQVAETYLQISFDNADAVVLRLRRSLEEADKEARTVQERGELARSREGIIDQGEFITQLEDKKRRLRRELYSAKKTR